MQRADGALELGAQRVGLGELAQVVVAGEQLVGALAGEHDAHVLAGHARRACSWARRCARARGRRTRSRARRSAATRAPRRRGSRSRGGRCRGTPRPCGRRAGPASRRCRPRSVCRHGALARGPAGGDRGDEAGVQAAGEEHADGDVAHHLAVDRVDERLARAEPQVGAGRQRDELVGHRARRSAPARPPASTRGPAGTARRRAASRGRTRASRSRSAPGRRSALPGGVQYSGLIPTGSRAATKRPSSRGHHERVHAVEPLQRLRAVLVEQVQRDLVVGGREDLAPLEPGADVLVVVDLAVADQERVGRAVRRGCAPPSTSTIDSRRWPSQLPSTWTVPRSSGPRWAMRSSIRSSSAGSEAPYSATIPHIERR